MGAYTLRQTTLILTTNVEDYKIPIGNLAISDSETIDEGKGSISCPEVPSVLGIDLLCKFDFIFKDRFVYLLPKPNDFSSLWLKRISIPRETEK
jgi:hypothetical protein